MTAWYDGAPPEGRCLIGGGGLPCRETGNHAGNKPAGADVNQAQPQRSSEESPAPSFEQALVELDQIVHLLEGSDVGLNEALASYERGVRLLRYCYDLLQKTERRIELLSGVDADGNPICTPLDDAATTVEQKAERRSRRRTASRPDSPPEKGMPANDTDMDVSQGLF